MIISEYLNNIKNGSNYISGSLVLKSSDNNGCVYKWLINNGRGSNRIEIFIELNSEESELDLLDKTVINSIEVLPAY